MKRRKRLPPLLELTEPPIYVIDSSSWFDIGDRSDRDAAWGVAIEAIKAGRVMLPVECIDEIRVDDDVWARLAPFETMFRVSSSEAMCLLAGRIAEAFPAMAKIRSIKTKADPFVIALASLQGALLVCHENGQKNPSRKIPTACKKFGVRCISLDDMLEIERNGKT
jgi:hypothetical protein